MEMTNVFSFHQHGDRDDNLATSFHIHYGDIIHLMRGGTALNILSPAIAHATNESCPPRMYLVSRGKTTVAAVDKPRFFVAI